MSGSCGIPKKYIYSTRPDSSRLDVWILSGGRAGSQFFLSGVWFFSPYFIVPKKSGGLRPILDLRVLSFAGSCVHTGNWCSSTSRRGKSKLVPTQRHEVRFCQPNSMPHPGKCSVGAELPQDFIRQDDSHTETFSEAPGAYGCSCCNSSARLLHMRPLQHWLHGRIGWTWKRGTHRVQITLACRKTFSPRSDPSFLRAGVPLEQVSRHAVIFTDASATGWGATYDGHTVFGRVPNCVGISITSSCSQYAIRPLRISTGKAVYIPVTARPPPPPLESEASEVPSCHPHPRSVQSGSQRAVSSSTSRGVEAPSPGGSADLGMVLSCSGGTVCISRNHPQPLT